MYTALLVEPVPHQVPTSVIPVFGNCEADDVDYLFWITGYAILIGICIGSFLNVLIDRLPTNQNVFVDRSHCDFCKKKLQWYELIPVISFVIQNGKCRHCHKTLSFQYPLVEIGTGIVYGIITFMFFFSNPWFFVGLILIYSALIVIFLADFKYFIIPDSMIVVAIFGALLSLIRQPLVKMGMHLLIGMLAASFFYALWRITKRRGMGFGDVKLAFFVGFFLGFPQIITALYLAFLTGAAVGIILIIRHKKTLKSRVPFGPFLIIGLLGSFVISIPKLLGF